MQLCRYLWFCTWADELNLPHCVLERVASTTQLKFFVWWFIDAAVAYGNFCVIYNEKHRVIFCECIFALLTPNSMPQEKLLNNAMNLLFWQIINYFLHDSRWWYAYLNQIILRVGMTFSNERIVLQYLSLHKSF